MKPKPHWWSPPRGDMALFETGLFLFAAGYLGWQAVRLQLWIEGALAALFLIAAIAFWFEQRWGRWFGAAGFAFVGAFFASLFFVGGWSWWTIIAIGFCAWNAWDLSRFEFGVGVIDDDDDDEIPTIAALLSHLPYIDTGVVASAALRAWGVELDTEEDDESTSFIAGEPPKIVVKHGQLMFFINVYDDAYFIDPNEIADSLVDGRSQRCVREHNAFIEIEAITIDPEDDENAWRDAAQLLVELVGSNCLAICVPELGRIVAWSEAVAEGLRSDDPLLSLLQIEHPPMVMVADDDPRMKAAQEESRAAWPRFVDAFENRSPDQNFSVKAPISQGENTEFIWMTVTAIENEVIYGRLDNEPVHLEGLSHGSVVRTSVTELNDWIFTDEAEEMQGGFTLKVIDAVVKEQQERG